MLLTTQHDNLDAFWRRFAPGANPTPPPDAAPTVAAYANHGRWVVACECGGAQLASDHDLRFWCVDCRNASVGGAWRRVEWPADAAAIDATLAARPDAETRNWVVGETAFDLVRENVAHEVA